MDNPFNPGSGTPPPFLAGRDEELAKFKMSLKLMADGKHSNLILTGLRGTGKTVLLNEFSMMCRRGKFFPVKRLQFTTKYNRPEDFANALEYDMSVAMSSLSVTKKASQKIKSVGSKLKPKQLGVPGAFFFEPSYTSKSIPFENYIENYLVSSWPVFKQHGYKGVIFLFDEFHLMFGIDKESYVLADFIGAINELQNKGFPYYLVLAGLPKLSLNVKRARSYAERMFGAIILDNLTKKEASLAISKPLKDSPYNFSKDLISAIVMDTGQYPYFIQFYCQEIICNVLKQNIDIDDYNSIKPIIINNLQTAFFDPRIDNLTDLEKKLLVSMAKINKKDLQFRTILTKSRIKKTSLNKYLDSLEKKGLVYNHKRGVYRFSLPMLQDYIVQKYIQS